MNDEDVQITLNRIYSDLQRVFQSRGWLHILNQIQEPSVFENSLGNALFHSAELKLRVNRIVEQKKENLR